ncbi:MAG: hypothetical protein MJE77_13005 [Proteobacteria bacterium]|nr:hypothetical protein [Pseudomonadota bacterium]
MSFEYKRKPLGPEESDEAEEIDELLELFGLKETDYFQQDRPSPCKVTRTFRLVAGKSRSKKTTAGLEAARRRKALGGLAQHGQAARTASQGRNGAHIRPIV